MEDIVEVESTDEREWPMRPAHMPSACTSNLPSQPLHHHPRRGGGANSGPNRTREEEGWRGRGVGPIDDGLGWRAQAEQRPRRRPERDQDGGEGSFGWRRGGGSLRASRSRSRSPPPPPRDAWGQRPNLRHAASAPGPRPHGEEAVTGIAGGLGGAAAIRRAEEREEGEVEEAEPAGAAEQSGGEIATEIATLVVEGLTEVWMEGESYISHIFSSVGAPPMRVQVRGAEGAEGGGGEAGEGSRRAAHAVVQLASRAAERLVREFDSAIPVLGAGRFNLRPGKTDALSVWVGGIDMPCACNALLRYLFRDEAIASTRLPQSFWLESQ